MSLKNQSTDSGGRGKRQQRIVVNSGGRCGHQWALAAGSDRWWLEGQAVENGGG